MNVISAKRAFSLLATGHASVVFAEDEDFRIFDMMDWVDFSRYNPPLAEIELVRTVRHPIRVPKIILLSIFDKMPKKGAQIDSQKRLRAGQASVPVLRHKAAARRLEFGSCDSQALRGQDDLGEYRLLLYQVQFPKSKPATTRGWHAFDTQAVEAAMATGDQYRRPREKA